MNEETKNGIMIGVTVILILVVVYFTTAVFMTGEIGGNKKGNKKTTATSSKVTSSYKNMIIASKTFSQAQGEYMVLFFDENEVSDNLKSALTSYDALTDKLKLYKVNVDEIINAYVKGDGFNADASNAKELKISDVTLLTIKGGKIASDVHGESEIINKLK